MCVCVCERERESVCARARARKKETIHATCIYFDIHIHKAIFMPSSSVCLERS